MACEVKLGQFKVHPVGGMRRTPRAIFLDGDSVIRDLPYDPSGICLSLHDSPMNFTSAPGIAMVCSYLH